MNLWGFLLIILHDIKSVIVCSPTIDRGTGSFRFKTMFPTIWLKLDMLHWLHNLFLRRNHTAAGPQVLLGWRLFKVTLKWFQYSFGACGPSCLPTTCPGRKYSDSTYFPLWNTRIQTWPSHDWYGIIFEFSLNITVSSIVSSSHIYKAW